ncbi:MAG: GNAT family N-acetyltransferase [Candidatus Zhuqueibacterota bacterium]
MSHIFLAGEKVLLSPIEPEDALFLAAGENDPEVRDALFLALPVSTQQQMDKIRLHQAAKDAVVFLIRERQTDNPIGQTAFFRIDYVSRAAVFYLAILDTEYWSRGFGTEATQLMVRYGFDTLNLHRIQLHVCAENIAAIKIYQKVGFKKEGILRQAMYRRGAFVDFWVMGLLKDEWPGTF